MTAARIPRVFTRLVSSTTPQPASTLLTSPAQNTYTTLTTKDLRALLQSRALKPWGKKPELISRLVASDAMSTHTRPEPSKPPRAPAGQERQGSNIARPTAAAAEKPTAPPPAPRAASTMAATFERAKAAVASTINGPTPTPAAPAVQRLEFTISPLAVPKPWELAALENPAEMIRVPYIQSTEATAKHREEVVPRVVVHQPAVNVLGEEAAGRVGVVTEVGDDTVVGVPGQVVQEGKEKVGEVVQEGKDVVGKAKEAVASWGGWGGKEKESKTGKIFAGDEGQAMTAEKESALKIGAVGAGAWVVLGEPVMRLLGIL